MLGFMSWRARLSFLPAGAASAAAQDAVLVARLRAGDADALSRLYQRESGAVYRYALALCGDEAAALDAMQEAFAQLLEAPQDFDAARGGVAPYLAGIARHRLLARWREARRFVSLLGDEDESEDEPADAVAPASDTLLVHAQDRAALWSAIRRLPWRQREALVLVDLQERSYEEAAHIARCSVDALRTRLHRARQRLAALLDPFAEAAGSPRLPGDLR